jgi:DNA-directed RNA polymerase subunit RPC12/RpoP
VPFTCEACGAGRDLIQIPARGTVLRCPQCGHERRYVRPPLLIVTGTPGAGKSTICARLAGRIPGAVLLDADVFAGQMISDVPPNEEYPAFWRAMTRLAHEISQNNLAVVFFSVMLPQQLLANTDVISYFESVSFLCLTCDSEALRPRVGSGGATRSAGPSPRTQACPSAPRTDSYPPARAGSRTGHSDAANRYAQRTTVATST